MKHIRNFIQYKRYVKVPDVINFYESYENAAIFLNIIFEGKYVKVIDGIFTYKNQDRNSEGEVKKIFYINTSGFIVIRFKKEDNDIIINNAFIQAYEDLDYELGELAIKSKKYNI